MRQNLTPRELEIAGAIASGLKNPAIACQFYITESTVKAHIKHIYEKLKLESSDRVSIANWFHRSKRVFPGILKCTEIRQNKLK